MGERSNRPPSPERWEVYYEGRVQGVGFRYTTQRIAAQFPVTGYVKNLSDGRVQVVLEGSPEEMERMLQTIQQVMGRYIGKVTRKKSAATGEFQRFEIRF